MEFLTIRETAKKTGIPENRVRQWSKMGVLPGFYAGTKFMINLDRFLEYLDKLSTPINDDIISIGKDNHHDKNTIQQKQVLTSRKKYFVMSWQEKYVNTLYPYICFVKPKDFEETVELYINGYDDNKYRDIVLDYFKFHKSVSNIASEMGCTTQYIYEILHDKYIRNRYNHSILFMGYHAYIQKTPYNQKKSKYSVCGDIDINELQYREGLSGRACCFLRRKFGGSDFRISNILEDYNKSKCVNLYEYFIKFRNIGHATATELAEAINHYIKEAN